MPHMAARMAMIFSRLVCSFINFRLQLCYIGRKNTLVARMKQPFLAV